MSQHLPCDEFEKLPLLNKYPDNAIMSKYTQEQVVEVLMIPDNNEYYSFLNVIWNIQLKSTKRLKTSPFVPLEQNLLFIILHDEHLQPRITNQPRS